LERRRAGAGGAVRGLLQLAPEVAQALAAGRPVVALESTLIGHGLPWPRNLETARRLERTVRRAGAVPATVAILDGELVVGLDGAGLERIARAGPRVVKVSRRDLAWVVARRLDGATTVAGTMMIAAAAGIGVFATGGIGGVHRGAGTSFDVSADLEELARSPVAVVCAGAKSILDLGATLEALETRGVPVIGYRTGRFPAFYVRASEHPLEHRAGDVRDLAAVVRSHRRLGLAGGLVIANPIPQEHALDPEPVAAAIERALADAARDGVAGKALTPYLLRRLEELTGGATLDANAALVEANARLAAELAVALADA